MAAVEVTHQFRTINIMSNLPEKQLRGLIDGTFHHARAQLVQHGELPPTFAIIGGDAPVVVPADFGSEARKDMMALMVRELVKLHEAHTVLLVSETWTLPKGMHRSEAKALYEKYGQVANMPMRQEAVMVTVETRDGQNWLCVAPIVRKGRAVKLAEIDYMDMASDDWKSQGRMAGWFAPMQHTNIDDLCKEEPNK